jgi:hypothetical protein
MIGVDCDGDVTKAESTHYFKMLLVKCPHDEDFVKLVSSHVAELSEDKAEAVRED